MMPEPAPVATESPPLPRRISTKLRLAVAGLLALVASMTIAASWRASAESAPPGNPLVGIDDRDAGAFDRGVVLERLGAGSYTYLRLRSLDDDAERWAVVLGRGASVGEQVAVTHFGTRRDFHSRRLDRTFDRLDFVMTSTLHD